MCNGPASMRTRSLGPVPAAAASRVPVSWSHRSGCLSLAGRLVLCPEPHGGQKGEASGSAAASSRQAPRQTLLSGMSRPLCSICDPRPHVQPPLSVPDPRPRALFPECPCVSHAVWLRPKHTGSQTPMLHTPPPRGPSQALMLVCPQAGDIQPLPLTRTWATLPLIPLRCSHILLGLSQRGCR